MTGGCMRVLDTLRSSCLRWIRNRKVFCDLLEPPIAAVRFDVETPRSDLLPRVRRIVMRPNERRREREELGIAAPIFRRTVLALREEVADVEERNDQEIEGSDRSLLDWEASIGITGEATLDLDSDLRTRDTRIRMNGDEIVPLIVRRRLVSEDVPTEEMSHHQVLSPKRHDGEPCEDSLGLGSVPGHLASLGV